LLPSNILLLSEKLEPIVANPVIDMPPPVVQRFRIEKELPQVTCPRIEISALTYALLYTEIVEPILTCDLSDKAEPKVAAAKTDMYSPDLQN
jgi:hypothetical protein